MINILLGVVIGFALIWHIWWMAGLGLIGTFLTVLLFAFRGEDEIEVQASEIALFDRDNQTEVAV